MNHTPNISAGQTIRFATAYAFIDLRNSFKRTPLGTLWRSLGIFAMIGLLGVFFGAILKDNIGPFEDYIVSLAAGMLIWEYLSNTLNQSCSIFSSSAQTLRFTRQPLAGILLRISIRNFLIFLQSTVLALIVYAVVFRKPPPIQLELLPGICLAFIGVAATGFMIGVACIRFRDLPQFVSWVTHIWFLLTPIIWPASILGRYSFLNDWNPAFHLVELFRAPLTGFQPSLLSWLFGGAITFVLLNAAVVTWRRYDARVPYWL